MTVPSASAMASSPLPLLLLVMLAAAAPPASASGEFVQELKVSEGAAAGTRVGFIGDGVPAAGDAPYFIVGGVEDLSVDETTGEIRTRRKLDRETRASYSFVAVGRTANVRVVVQVLDENDNAPTFPTPVMSIEFPENTPRDFKRTLHPAKDLDLDVYNTQCYNIVSGNVNNAFRLSSHRERDGVLYLDLQINGFLDREATAAYSLVIEALDGGVPPLRGEMTVNITIQDVNDNQPIFNQSRYFAVVPENATVGTTVLQVFATDTDAGENGQIEYSINRRQSDRDSMFRIDPSSGTISVNRPLDFETKELHELVIVAKDHGLQPLETTAFVSIRVTDVNDNQPTINVIFLSDDATPKISESAQPGEFVARISVHDPDSKTEYSNINVTLSGGDGHFNLTTQNNVIYLVVVSLPLDRELQPNYTLSVVATDTGTPPLHASKTINLQVTDINDNAPEFEREVYQTNVMEVSDPGSSVIQVTATDKDEGNNSAVTYTLKDTPETHSSWFQIDHRSGLVTTRAHVDCETDPMPKLTVIATDNGFPPLSSSATVLVTIHDVNDNEPIFDQSFYNVSVAENETKGKCILKVSATDPDCGINAMVNYTLGEGFGKQTEFRIRSSTGEICISSELDYETRNVYEFPIVATDRGGLSTTAMVKIQVTDVNDNRPSFYPREYNVSLREGGASSSATTPVVIVAATDPDSGRFGSITFRIVAGNEAGLFRIDKNTGEIFVSRPSLLSSRSQPYHRLNISATDGGGLRSLHDAEVFISIIDSTQRPPIFEFPRYTYAVREDVSRDTVIGSVKASVRDYGGHSGIRYSIYSGDPDGLFRIDPITGSIQTALELDHETRATVLLNVQATSGDPPVYGHTQVNIEIEDVNDNSPEFESSTVRISVPENVETGTPLYAAHARDRDSGSNGVIRYKIANAASNGGLFEVDTKTGHLTLKRHLDYEIAQRHSLIITATDTGIPPLSANLTILVEVQDVNDNPPVFEQAEYSVKVLETLPVNWQILQVVAVDLDTGNNARLTYRLVSVNGSTYTDSSEIFGIFPNSGWIYLRGNLDREAADRYALVVAATDNGTPPETATTKVTVSVLDANDNDPVFVRDSYEFYVEENLAGGALVGAISASDRDAGANAAIRYGLIPGNSSFHIDPINGEITTKAPLDREQKEVHDLVAEARDQGSPPRSARITVRIRVLDVNDNAPEIVDPQEDVVSVREEQSPGTEVARVKAVDADRGQNASVTYAILRGKDSDGYGVFSIDPTTGVIRTRMLLDHEEKTIYRIAVAATDGGNPPKQTVRVLRVEVLDLNDNRPTFTSSSLIFRISENAKVGHTVGSVATTESSIQENIIPGGNTGHVTYTLTSLMSDYIKDAFEIDRNTGSLVVSRELDREIQSEYRLEVRALDTSAMNNPQSSAVTVRVDIADVNDNAPQWPQDPITIQISESTEVGSSLYNFTASDADSGSNGELRYSLIKQFPKRDTFKIDSLTGTLILANPVDYEELQEHMVVVKVTDQPLNVSEQLSSSVTARIIVTDSNDNAPKFVVPSTANVFMSESSIIGTPIIHLVAIDKDSGDNGRVTYVITNGNEGSYFALGYETGFLTLAKSLTPADSARTFVLNVTASDHGNPTRQASTELRLSIQGSVDNPPKFLNAAYQASIAEDATVGSSVIKVLAKSGLLEQGGNITYHIPSGIANDVFAIHPKSGTVSIRKSLDRETTDSYLIPVYVIEFTTDARKSLFDITTLSISVMDVNDHAPNFSTGSCYPLAIPENNDKAIIHTVVATDLDTGKNGHIIYSITSGNFENKFYIDSNSGELTALPLDRESRSRYYLTITAQDHGNPVLKATCNITVMVEDKNDNDPKFDLPKYSATILENIPVDTSVLKVHASDADVGVNSRLIYSLANESQWLFRIDNKTGILTTAGVFDRERLSTYNFLVVATDNGKYDARSQKVPVTIHVGDVNDNKPIFTQHPFRANISPYVPPGQTILRVSAKDIDQGMNAEIVYSLPNDGIHNKFRVNPNTGTVTTTQSLASENGRILYLNVIATDKGNPSQSSTGLIEIAVGDVAESTPKLIFQNDTYNVLISENTDQFRDVCQVSAVRTDGRKQKVWYSIGSGNEENIFLINSNTGVIQVREPKFLDYELHNTMRLVVEAKSESSSVQRGYATVLINLADQNDNAPKFTQQQYTASVWEGNNKGTFVLQVVAFDADQNQNSRVLYHIVDGNHDNAFLIEPVFSGILKTNIVLDREIRDKYRLTVIATDEGVPQMTGTARISINVVDVNDNQPTFPPPSTINVTESTNIGSVLTTVTANDVDTYPTLTYSIAKESGREVLNFFGIDRYSGKVVLKRRLDFETQQEFRLLITASDTDHIAQTTLTVKVTDVNDNAPVFSQPAYYATLPEGHSINLVDILTVNASDADTENNGKIKYSLLSPPTGFSIGIDDGVLRANLSNITSTPSQDIELIVKASDMGTPHLFSTASIRLQVNSAVGADGQSNKRDFRIQVSESTPRGTTLLQISNHGSRNEVHHFVIVEGGEDGTFEISNPTGSLILVRPLDREHKDMYNLKISNGDGIFAMNFSTITVSVTVEDVNDNAPVFEQSDFEETIVEGVEVGTSIKTISATDADLVGTPSSEVIFEITSGNDMGLFVIDQTTGVVSVNKKLDYDEGDDHCRLVISACDSGEPPLCTLATFHISLEDENDNDPQFPVTEYLEFVGENEPVGTPIFAAHATDADKGIYGTLNYSIVNSTQNNYVSDESWRFFHIDSNTGLLSTNAIFDYEQRNRYTFFIAAIDFGGRSAHVKVRLEIESRDEFHPQFTEKTYRFILATPPHGSLPAGYVVGHVTATDRDKGPDGRVVYQLTTQNMYFKINRTTGAIVVRRKFENSELMDAGKEVSLIVTASSGRQGSLTNNTVVEITLDPLADPGTNLAINNDSTASIAPNNGGITDWALGLLIALILLLITFGAVLVFLHMRNKRNKNVNKPGLSSDTVPTSNNYVDPSAFDTIPIRGTGSVVTGTGNQFGPPKYDEIPPYGPGNAASSNSGAATTSELSGSEQSGSSGRGSAEDGEDGEDEEIRMINEGPLQRESGLRQNDDEDNLSDVSVRNTQEYLARLGIVNNSNSGMQQTMRAGGSKDVLHHHQGVPLDSLRMFDEEGNNENDITNLIYAKLNDVAVSDRASSADEGGGVNSATLGSTMDHVMAIGGYNEVPTVTHQPSMNGSLSSIVHSEEELAGSYNWDYLLDWGPQYQPLAHVFSEIARLKDDTASVQSAASGNSSVKSKNSVAPAKNIPPPLITNVAPRSITVPVLNSRGGSSHHMNNHNQMIMLPRSPINHDASGATFSSSTAMSPSFSPSLSPLATKSPSISPLVTPGLPTTHHVMPRQPPQLRNKALVDTELRI